MFVGELWERMTKGEKFRLRYETLQQSPRFILEFISILSMSLLTIYFIYMDMDLNNILINLGLFTVALFRIMPSSNRIIKNINDIKFGLNSVRIIDRELSNFKVNQRPTVIGEDLPYEWAKELAIKLVGAPAIDLKDSDTIDLVVKMFSEVSWIDSRSVKVALALPEGLRVTYKSRIPVLSLAVGEQYLGLLSLDGYMLPEGFSKSQLDKFIKIVVEKTTKMRQLIN